MKKAAQAIPNQKLINERLRNHWSQQEVADRIGTTRINVNRWERGITFPGLYFRQQLCTLFDKSFQELRLLPGGQEVESEQKPKVTSPQQETALILPPVLPSEAEDLASTSSDLPVQEPSQSISLPPSLAPVGSSQICLSRRKMLIGLVGGTVAVAGGSALLLLSRSEQRVSKGSSMPVKPQLIGRTLCDYRQHHLMVRCVAWSLDGKYLLSAGGDPVVRVWLPDSEVRQTVRLYEGHHNRVNAAAWSPDGTRIASTSDRTVHIWEVASGKKLFVYLGHTDIVRTVAWCPNGQYIVSRSDDTTAQVWDALTGEHISTYHGHTAPVLTVAWSPVCNRIASGGHDTTIHVWESLGGRSIYLYYGHQCTVHTIAWAPDTIRIASGSADKTVQVWGAATGKNRFIDYKAPTRVVTLAWSPNSQQLAFGGYDRPTVQMNDVLTDRVLFTYRKHTNSIHAVAWSPDGTRIASGGSDKTVHVWEAL